MSIKVRVELIKSCLETHHDGPRDYWRYAEDGARHSSYAIVLSRPSPAVRAVDSGT
jgi:hypothetical protein